MGPDEKVEQEVERLTEPDHLESVESGDPTRSHSVRAEISNAMVGLKKEFYGKGPTKAKTFLNDNYVFCAMEGGLTRNEETLIERGHEDLVRTYRLRFQEAMEEPTIEAVQRITGRTVIGYHSQIVFNPERAFEIFVVDRPVEGPVSATERSGLTKRDAGPTSAPNQEQNRSRVPWIPGRPTLRPCWRNRVERPSVLDAEVDRSE